jgi:hypothetical protein
MKDDKFFAVTGTKDHFWIEAEMFLQDPEKYQVDTSYFEKLVDTARNAIDYFGSFVDFVK